MLTNVQTGEESPRPTFSFGQEGGDTGFRISPFEHHIVSKATPVPVSTQRQLSQINLRIASRQPGIAHPRYDSGSGSRST
jgi:hypothetical protein